jgi:hypothetical protein
MFLASLAAALVARLQEFYLRLPSLDLPRSLDACHRSVPLALNALSALNELKFDVEAPTSTQHSKEIDGIRCKQPQRKAKHAKRQSRINLFTDTAPFDAIGRDVPRTKEEADQMAAQILEDQKGVLEVCNLISKECLPPDLFQEYLSVLKIPELSSTFENLYTLAERPAVNTLVAPKTTVAEGRAPVHDTALTSDVYPAFPQIQPLKAAKYFSEPAEGFGQWNLLLSSRAIQHLRSYHRDQATWSIIKKKMQCGTILAYYRTTK